MVLWLVILHSSRGREFAEKQTQDARWVSTASDSLALGHFGDSHDLARVKYT